MFTSSSRAFLSPVSIYIYYMYILCRLVLVLQVIGVQESACLRELRRAIHEYLGREAAREGGREGGKEGGREGEEGRRGGHLVSGG